MFAAGCSVQLLQKGACVGSDRRCAADNGLVCSQQREVGPCRGAFKRWYYDNKTKLCQEFYFGGCRGNSNNFMKYEDCAKRCHQDTVDQEEYQADTEDIFLNDEFRDALDILVKKRRRDRAENMNEGFMEIEEQGQAVQRLEMEEKEAASTGSEFRKMGELNAARKKLMMMEKHRMMNKQMMMFKQKQAMMARQKEMMDKQQRQILITPQQLTSSLTQPFNISTEEEQVTKRFANSNNPMYPSYCQAQDCAVTAWSPWSVSCSASCGHGHRHRFRSVTQEARGGGRRCPDKMERFKRCRLPSCPRDQCDSAAWSAWGPCSATCGSSGIQVRLAS